MNITATLKMAIAQKFVTVNAHTSKPAKNRGICSDASLTKYHSFLPEKILPLLMMVSATTPVRVVTGTGDDGIEP